MNPFCLLLSAYNLIKSIATLLIAFFALSLVLSQLDPPSLFILGTGRHESRRIDLQLRGRSGRQGDVGETVFYLSLEDNLMRLFGSERIAKVMDRMGLKEGEVITHNLVTRSIERAQKKVEAMNFGGRKNIIEYDDVMNYQREIVYDRRNHALHKEDITDELDQIIKEYIDDEVALYCSGNKHDWDLDGLNIELLNIFGIDFTFKDSYENSDKLKDIIIKKVNTSLHFKRENFDQLLFNNFQKYVILKTIDQKWQDHLYTMDQLREGIGLRAYGQKNPLIEYKQEGFAMFENMMIETNKETLKRIFRTDLSSISQNSMQNNQQPKNIKAKSNVNILSSVANQNKSSMQPQNMLGTVQNPGLSKELRQQNQARQPIKVEKKVGRNEPCPCGSEKKYKKCHGKA